MESSGRLERPGGTAAAGRGASIAIIVFCQVAAMAVWFSASAVVPALKAQAAIDDATASLFTSAVQLGFVLGTLACATLGLADGPAHHLDALVTGIGGESEDLLERQVGQNGSYESQLHGCS